MPYRPKRIKRKNKNPMRESDFPQSRSDTYGANHQKLREQRLNMFPFCEAKGCQRFSEEAHHLCYPARSIDDYRALCLVCHDIETRGGK